jgi:hypothetical protein
MSYKSLLQTVRVQTSTLDSLVYMTSSVNHPIRNAGSLASSMFSFLPAFLRPTGMISGFLLVCLSVCTSRTTPRAGPDIVCGVRVFRLSRHFLGRSSLAFCGFFGTYWGLLTHLVACWAFSDFAILLSHLTAQPIAVALIRVEGYSSLVCSSLLLTDLKIDR